MTKRNLAGECNPSHKLKRYQVDGIRKLYEIGGVTQTRLAEIYGVRQETIWRILAKKTWNQGVIAA